ncbi:hypothetical protein OC834_005988 [Tilletia horrida]|uniref:SH3 domain-containing protein n=1 Tax=Tilletia horrida TaxID=155126 RepID=A0AAN6JGK8_9BASI|nr:hypothetical protein OC842_007759 [Tilletia horrida]KAK0523204.1 hypothetical protein OC834_005988 [Tilletia horrida]
MQRIITSLCAAAALGAAALLPTLAIAQSDNGCVSLRGSKSCPAFQDAYVNPTNLSNAWPWFTAVTDVQSFDEQFDLYFTDPNRYHQTKFQRQLQCNSTAALNTTLQWQRTILCGQFSQISYSASCNVRNRVNPIMVCQDTCVQYAKTEDVLIANPQICPPDNQLSVFQNNTRYFNLNKDYTTCTNWTTLVSTDSSSCVEGITNEGNCGWGPNVNNQLCDYCDPTGNQTIPSCCYDAKTDLSQCSLFGYPGAATVRPTTSVGTTMGPTSTSSSSSNPVNTGSGDNSGIGNSQNSQGGKRYSGGQIAGIVVGCVVGALLLGLLLGLLCFRRKADKRDAETAAGAGNGRGDAEKTRMLGNISPDGHGAGGAGLLAAGAGAGAYAAGGRDNEKDGWQSPLADEKFAEKEAARPGSSALAAPPSHGSNATGGRFSPVSGSGAAAAGVGGALLGAAAASSGSNSNRALSSTPTQMAASGAASSKEADENRPMSALSNTTTTDGRGTTVPAVRDQYSGLDIQPQDEVIAIYPYSATLTDEMNLEVDDVITVLRLYDDGWALGRRARAAGVAAGSNEGAFPLVCVTHSQAVDGPASRGMGGSMPGASSDDGGLTSGAEGVSDSADGAVTADEGAVTADEDFESSRRR